MNQDFDDLRHEPPAPRPRLGQIQTETRYPSADYVQTYTGRRFHVMNPSVEMVSVIDIAHSLANISRFNGRTRKFYSVAQHCCQLVDYALNEREAPPIQALQILMHDAAEAYIGDVVRPIKKYVPEFRRIEYEIQGVVQTWLGIDNAPPVPYLDEIDSRICTDEKRALTGDIDGPHCDACDLTPLGMPIEAWPAERAERMFLYLYATLAKQVHGRTVYVNESWRPTGAKAHFAHDVSTDDDFIEDVIEVDVLGKVGRVKLRMPDLAINERIGLTPPWRWVHGEFSIVERT